MQELQISAKPVVIVIDDDEAMRHSLEWLIKSSGHEVLSYGSAKSYLGDPARDVKPGCVVLDVHMPEINGLEMYGLLKNQHPDVSVIFITGYPTQNLAYKARALESKGFFTKPLDTDALMACIDKVVASADIEESDH